LQSDLLDLLFGHDGLPWFVVGDLEVIGVVDVLVRTFGEGDLHNVLFELGDGLAADHAVLVAQRPAFLGNVVAALTAEVKMGSHGCGVQS